MRKTWKPGAVEELLTRPWPIDDLDDRKKVYHFSQFFALRQLALEKGSLSQALRAQENMAALDQRWAAANPLPRRISEMITAKVDGITTLLPVGEKGNETTLLDTVLKASRAKAKDGDQDGDDDG
jgi:hypothetical protein